MNSASHVKCSSLVLRLLLHVSSLSERFAWVFALSL
jgi:hypothetical protein